MGLFSKKQAAPDLQAVEQAFLQLKEQSLKEQLAGKDRTALFDAELGVYQRWYFEYRLEEEVARATRYSQTFALIVVKLERGGRSEDDWRNLKSRAVEVLTGTFRATDLVAVLDDGVFAVCILNSTPDGAELAGQRLETALADIPHALAGTLFPYDNLGADQLLKATRHRTVNAQLQDEQRKWAEMPTWMR